MNDKTKYEIMKNRELLKGYHAADVTAEETDQQQKLPSIPCLQTSIATDTIKLPTDYEHLPIKGTILDLIKNRESRRSYQVFVILPDIRTLLLFEMFPLPAPATPLRLIFLSTKWKV